MPIFPLIVSDCHSPMQELIKVAINADMDEKLLEARIKQVSYFMNIRGQAPKKLPPAEIPFLDDAGFMLQHDLQLEQRLVITIDRATSSPYSFSLRLSEDKRELYCCFHQGSKIPKDEKGIRLLFERIRVQKADLQVIIRDEKTEYQRLLAFINGLSSDLLSENREFLLTKGVGGASRIDPHLELKVRLPKKGYFIVQEKELIAIFYKGQAGEAARDCLGRFIPPSDFKETGVLPLVVNDAIEAKEETREIKYYAKSTGYLSYSKRENTLHISQQLNLTKATLATTGFLPGGLNTPTHISIKTTDLLEDAVGEGMVVEAGTVEVIGNVGNKVIIRANKVIVKGQTHQGSQIYADDVSITIHKGLVVGKRIQISRLEAGVAKGDDIKIENVYGGKSSGEDVKLITLHSNHKAYCSKKLVINSLKGEDNVLTICASAAPEKFERYQTFMEIKKELKLQVQDKKKQYDTEFMEVKRLQPLIKQFKEELASRQNNSPAKMKIIKEQMLNYKNLVTFIQRLQDEIQDIENKLQKIGQEIDSFEENIHHAYILSKSGWRGYNKVRYKRLSDELDDVVLIPRMQDGAKICLAEDRNVLVSVKELF